MSKSNIIMNIKSKLPKTGTTIFTVMSALANEYGAINLSQGFPDFSSSERLHRLVYDFMKRGYNQYPPMRGVTELLQQLSVKIDRMYGIRTDPLNEITITAGATQALFTAIAAFVFPGDEVILIEPAYDSYRPSIEVMGGIPIPFELSAPDYRINWKALATLVTPRTRMIIINTPQNPTGMALHADDLLQLDALTRNTDILVLSDEVYEHLIYDGREHQSVLRFPELRRRSIACYSFGKTFHNTGWKIGYAVAPPDLTQEFRKVHQFNVFTVNTPVQYGLAEFLKDPEEYLNLPDFYQRKRDFFLDAMAGSPLRPLQCEGTYFHLFDFSRISEEADTEFARRLTTEYGVAAIPVSVFYSGRRDDKVIRLCFAKKESTLKEAGTRLKKLMG